jgi:tRNA-uridine 2-sulfurtransferase
MARVVLAMSGGVDSSVAAHLLLEAGHEVIGVFMRHGEESPVACATDIEPGRAGPPTTESLEESLEESDPGAMARKSGDWAAERCAGGSAGDSTGRRPWSGPSAVAGRPGHQQGCCTAADARDARFVADKLALPFYALNMQQEFRQVIDYFTDQYRAGRTPNPCIQCNRWLKFGKLFGYADSIGAEFVATGHYARLQPMAGGIPALVRGCDADKDQSYVLFGTRRDQLNRMLLPVGDFHKRAVRQIALDLNLRVAEKRESQEICFVTHGRYDQFVRSQQGHSSTAGEIITTDGTVVGHHRGIEGFTVGQRKGLGVALGQRMFVVRIEAESRRVVLGTHDELGRLELVANQANWLVEAAEVPRRCQVQIRYQSRPAPAQVDQLADHRLRIRFDHPQYGVAPGQAAVCYDGIRVLGGGWIE